MTPTSDPRRLADVVLAAAVRASADAVYIEPVAENDDAYELTFERDRSVLSTITVER